MPECRSVCGQCQSESLTRHVPCQFRICPSSFLSKAARQAQAVVVSRQVLSQIMYAMYSSDRAVVQRCACALAHMASIPDLHAAFVERKGLDILVDMLTDSKRDTRDAVQREAASARCCSRPKPCITPKTSSSHRRLCLLSAPCICSTVGSRCTRSIEAWSKSIDNSWMSCTPCPAWVARVDGPVNS